ncbi:WD40 repeat-like protein [Auricularia subglabra TFB-10046 SS5]|uniref:WD40 repeat-like protein n=1 Tax=Auricularia subglabra (strain TFB-10046 / SS5) TaxID=717982 RepID=J0D4C4_AURST|nr:WD40 repeat-like protein [Auricularia subglabra TFB-10046 SS5]
MTSYTVWRTLTAHTQIVNFIAFSATGELLATGDDGGTVNVWSLASGKLFQSLPMGDREAVSCCWGDDKELFVGYGDGEIQFYEHNRLTNRFERNARVRPGDNHISCLAIHGNRLACGSGNTVHCWRIEGTALRHILRWTFDNIREVRTVHFVDRHTLLATALYEGHCILLDVLEPSKPLWRRRLSQMISRSGEAALSSDGRYLTITNLASAVQVHEILPSGIRLWKEFASPARSSNNFPTQTCFAEFQKLVISGSDNGEVRLWNAQTNERFALSHGGGWRFFWRGESGSARIVQAISAFSSADYHYLASACCDGAGSHVVRVWRRDYKVGFPTCGPGHPVNGSDG